MVGCQLDEQPNPRLADFQQPVLVQAQIKGICPENKPWTFHNAGVEKMATG
jgi:hypothetical protein